MAKLIVRPRNLRITGNGFHDWIDRELVRHSSARARVSERDLDHLLELRELISRHREMEPARVIRDFFLLRRQLEGNFYLLCYRLRNWVAVHYQLEISDPLDRVPASEVALDLTHNDFGRLLTSARQAFFENADQLVPWGDLRVRVIARQE